MRFNVINIYDYIITISILAIIKNIPNRDRIWMTWTEININKEYFNGKRLPAEWAVHGGRARGVADPVRPERLVRGLAGGFPLLRQQQQVEFHAFFLQGGPVPAAARPVDRLPVQPRVRNQGETQKLPQVDWRGGVAAG